MSLRDSLSSSPVVYSSSVSDWTFVGCGFFFKALHFFFVTVVATFLVLFLGGMVLIPQYLVLLQQLKNSEKVKLPWWNLAK